MRVTNGMMVNNLLRNLSNNTNRLDEYNRQLSTGKQFDMPSQNPTGAVRSMDLESTMESNKQYNKNIDEALTWVGATESALKDATKIVQRTRELVVHGANDSLSDTDREGIADEVEELKNNLSEVANTSYGDSYIFAGQKVEVEPYQTVDPSDPDFGYRGDEGKITREISRGVEMDINQNGAFFEDVFERMDDLANDLRTGDIKQNSETRIDEMDASLNNIIKKRSEIGAKQNRLELTQSRLEDDKIKFKKLLSENEDVDIAETIMNLKMSENVHRAALSSGARVIQPTLMDFLK